MTDEEPLSRRRFLQGVAAAPIAGGLRAQTPAARARVAVVGAGAFGGWTAWHLLEGGAEVTLIDAWGPGNPRSSSGGESRVIRAIYGGDEIYTRMVRRAYSLWDGFDAEVDEALYTPTGALWMVRDDDRYVRKSLPILDRHGFAVDELSLTNAAARWPQIDFAGIRKVYLEREAGALSARRCCISMRNRLLRAGATWRTARAQPGAIEAGRLRSLRLADGGDLEADAFVFACGPWLGQLFPEAVGERVRPTRQEVFYFGPPAGNDDWSPKHMPVWIDFGERVLYGLPDVHGRGFKFADDTRGPSVEPTSLDRTPSAEGLARARDYLATRFPALAAAPLVESRVCQYENSPDGHLILDRHPQAENLWIAGGGSGHGFKLAPAVGEMMATAVLGGEQLNPLFSLSRFSEDQTSRTQFETT